MGQDMIFPSPEKKSFQCLSDLLHVDKENLFSFRITCTNELCTLIRPGTCIQNINGINIDFMLTDILIGDLT